MSFHFSYCLAQDDSFYWKIVYDSTSHMHCVLWLYSTWFGDNIVCVPQIHYEACRENDAYVLPVCIYPHVGKNVGPNMKPGTS